MIKVHLKPYGMQEDEVLCGEEYVRFYSVSLGDVTCEECLKIANKVIKKNKK